MKKILSTCVCLFLMAGSWSFGAVEELSIKAKGRYTVADTSRVNIVMPRTYLTEEELKEFIKRVDRSYSLTMEYLDIEEVNRKIYFTLVVGRYISNTNGDRIGLSYVRDNRSPYTHELVHAMTNINIKEAGIPNWLYEGMAIYINDLYNENGSAPNYGENIHTIARRMIHKKEFQEVLSFDDKYKWTSSGVELRHAFYIFSGSFSRYILENYGKAYFMDLYRNRGMDWLQTDEGKRIYSQWSSFIKGSS